MVAAAHERQHVLAEAAQDLVEVLGLVGRRAAEPRGHLVRVRAPQRRNRRIAQPLDEHVDRAVAELPHRLRVEPEWIFCQDTPSSAGILFE